MNKVIVASTNPVKVNAARSAFEKMFPGEQFSVEGITVASGVKDQPMTDEETHQGALNRAQNAKIAFPDADYWVGLEGGVDYHHAEMRTFAWMVVMDAQGHLGSEKTATHKLPPKVVELIEQGMELGHADDLVFQRTNSKQTNGSVGLLTHDVVTRTMYYEQALVLALVPFRNAELYFAD